MNGLMLLLSYEIYFADDSSKMSTSLDSAELEKQTTVPLQQQQRQQQLQQMVRDEHITMDLYRAFMSNAG